MTFEVCTFCQTKPIPFSTNNLNTCPTLKPSHTLIFPNQINSHAAQKPTRIISDLCVFFKSHILSCCFLCRNSHIGFSIGEQPLFVDLCFVVRLYSNGPLPAQCSLAESVCDFCINQFLLGRCPIFWGLIGQGTLNAV